VIIVKNRNISRPVKEKEPRPRGRPRAFDVGVALARAAETFWRLGYEGASIADLTKAMRITPQSLYAAFTSKADLYRETLGWYRTEIGATFGIALDEPDVVRALERFLTECARQFSRPGRPHGCMIAAATLTCAVENAPVARHLSALRGSTRERLRARIERGIAEGQLRSDADAIGLARFVGALMQGMSVQAKDGAGEQELQTIVAHGTAEIARYRRHDGNTIRDRGARPAVVP
jgi:AcrR family transcriptional regulator